MTITLNVEDRSERGKRLKDLRDAGKLPAVVYGAKTDTQAISLDQKEFSKAFREAGESTVLVLKGLDEDKEVLVHDVSYNPIKGAIDHVDFYAVTKGAKVTVNVPIVFVGEAPAVKLGGSLTKALHEVEVTGEPSKLPHEIEVDVSSLETFEDHIKVEDLKVAKNLTIENNPEDTVALVSEAKDEPEPEVVEAADVPTVDETEKKEDGSEAG